MGEGHRGQGRGGQDLKATCNLLLGAGDELLLLLDDIILHTEHPVHQVSVGGRGRVGLGALELGLELPVLCRGTQAGGLGVALGLVGVTAGPGPACSSVSSGVEEGRAWDAGADTVGAQGGAFAMSWGIRGS